MSGRLLLAVVLFAGCSSGGEPGIEAPASTAEAAPPVELESLTVRFGLAVVNPSNVRRSSVLVQGGFPFAEGVVTDPRRLHLFDHDGKLRTLQARTLAHWPDGSVKWVELSFLLPALAASERRELTLGLAADVRASGPETDSGPALPEGLQVELTDEKGAAAFELQEAARLYEGPIAVESRFSGGPAGRSGETAMTLSVTRFPTASAVRYRIDVEQLVDGGTWRRLRVRLPQPRAIVHLARELGASVIPGPEGSQVTLVADGRHAADRGFGRRWEIWGYDDPRTTGGPPLRPEIVPSHLRASGALGELPASLPRKWRRAFDRSWDRILKKRDADPANAGWKHHGDFADRGHGVDYLGYLNQEYDPATALFLAYGVTGEPRYREQAELLGSFFRDMCVGPDGGVYHHRATLHAAQTHLIDIMSRGLSARIREHREYRQTPEALVAIIADLYGDVGRRAGRGIALELGTLSPAEFERRFVRLAADRLLEFESAQIRESIETLAAEERSAFGMRELFVRYANRPEIARLGFTDPDAAFAPFFGRYGGSWSDFPGFHVDPRPNRRLRHSGSHALVEMLALSYFITGDEGLRRVALRVAEHHIDDLVPRAIESNRGMIRDEGELFSRAIAWPLINLIALADLTRHRDPQLHARIREAASKLAAQLMRNEPQRCEGSISAGVAMEALARYHRWTGDAPTARALAGWAAYWAATQWNEDKRSFRYRRDQPGGSKELTGLTLYGLAYAADLDPSATELRRRVVEARDSLLDFRTDYAKSFAMAYRNSTRALALIENWAQPSPRDSTRP